MEAGIGFCAPVSRVVLPPPLNPLDIFRSVEVIAILGFLQPSLLTVGLAGLAAIGFLAELLTVPISWIRNK